MDLLTNKQFQMRKADFIESLTEVLHKKGFPLISAARTATCIADDISPVIMEDDNRLQMELATIANALTRMRMKINLSKNLNLGV